MSSAEPDATADAGRPAPRPGPPPPAGPPTDCERVDCSLRTEEARLRSVLAGLMDGVVTMDLHGTIRDASDSMEPLFGWKPEELVGRNVRVLMPDPHRSAHDGYLARYRETGRTHILGHVREFEAVRRDGSRFDIELAVSRVDVPGTETVLLCGVLRDATARKVAERALAASEQRFRAVFDQEYQLMLMLDEAGRVMDANQAAEHSFGVPPDDLRGRLLWEAPWWHERPELRADLEAWVRRAAEGELVRSELDLVTPAGDPRTMDLSLKRVVPVPGEPPLLVAEARDVTDMRRAQRRETSMLRALATIGENASILAHEVKNPITSIHVALRAVARQLGQDEAAALVELLERLRKLEATIRRTLSFAKPLDMQLAPTDPGDLLASAADQLRAEAEDCDVSLTVEVEAGVPHVLADVEHLEECLVNLVRNALDALVHRERGRVVLSAREGSAGEVLLRVEDDGPGIPGSLRETLFNPFVTNKASGTGIGLALCRKIAEEQGGRIAARDSELGGACFELRLPAAVRPGA